MIYRSLEFFRFSQSISGMESRKILKKQYGIQTSLECTYTLI